MYAFYEFVRHNTVLEPGYMALGVNFSALPLVAVVLLHSRPDRWRFPTLQTTLACASIVGALLFGAVPAVEYLFHHLEVAMAAVSSPLATILVTGVAGLLIVAALPASVRALTLAIWFAIFNCGLAGGAFVYGIGSPGIQRSMLTLYRQTDIFTTQLDPSLSGIKYWFASETIQTPEGPIDVAGVFNSYVATRGWLGNLLGIQSPSVPLGTLGKDHVMGATCVGLLSPIERHESTREAFVKATAAAGIPAFEVARRQFTAPELSYELSVYRVVAATPKSGAPPCLATR
jgi:hypothetical protein